MIESIERTSNSRFEDSWVGGFPISLSSTTETRVFEPEIKRRRDSSSSYNWSNDIFVSDNRSHVVQIECVVNIPILRWESQLEVLTASSRQDQIVNETLEQIYALERKSQGRFAARMLMVFVEANFRKKNLTLTSSLLEKVKLNMLGMHALIGLTRSTLRARARLPAWDAVYKKSRLAVEERGFKADDMFIGMPSVEGALRDERNRAND